MKINERLNCSKGVQGFFRWTVNGCLRNEPLVDLSEFDKDVIEDESSCEQNHGNNGRRGRGHWWVLVQGILLNSMQVSRASLGQLISKCWNNVQVIGPYLRNCAQIRGRRIFPSSKEKSKLFGLDIQVSISKILIIFHGFSNRNLTYRIFKFQSTVIFKRFFLNSVCTLTRGLNNQLIEQ